MNIQYIYIYIFLGPGEVALRTILLLWGLGATRRGRLECPEAWQGSRAPELPKGPERPGKAPGSDQKIMYFIMKTTYYNRNSDIIDFNIWII